MNKINFDTMSRIVAHRNMSIARESQRVYLRRMVEKAKKKGIDFYSPEDKLKQSPDG